MDKISTYGQIIAMSVLFGILIAAVSVIPFGNIQGTIVILVLIHAVAVIETLRVNHGKKSLLTRLNEEIDESEEEVDGR